MYGFVYVCDNIIYFVIFFFFSSRRRHTRFDCDWSSDVCSSDLEHPPDSTSPFIHSRLLDENSQREHVPPVQRHHVHVLRPCRESPVRLLHFVEIVLIYVTCCCRIGFDAPNGLGAAHLAIIRADSGYVNWSAEWSGHQPEFRSPYCTRNGLTSEPSC